MRAVRLVAFAAAVAVAAVAASPAARADRRKSIKIYKHGKRLYQHHHYAAAIAAFKDAYDEHAAPAYLYNIAQAYRQLGRCPDALFFYKQFAAQTSSAKYRRAARRRIRALKSSCGHASPKAAGAGTAAGAGGARAHPHDGAAARPDHKPAAAGGVHHGGALAVSAAPAAGGAGAGSGDARPVVAHQVPGPASARPVAAHRAPVETGGANRAVVITPPGHRGGIVAVAEGGAAFHDIGSIVLPVTPMLRVGAGYRLPLGRLALVALAAAELSPMSYQKMTGSGTALFTNGLAEIQASYPLGGALRVGAGAGAGVLVISGLEDGNPFVAGGAAKTITAFAVRVGLTAAYRLASRISIAVTPALTYAPAGGALAPDIDAITRFEVLAGVRYRR